MKSAYELAMERMEAPREYSDEQKKQLAEIDSRYEAKEAEARMGADQKIKEAMQDTLAKDAAREELARDLSRIAEKQEAEKDKVRGE
jgi:hypothetical protein